MENKNHLARWLKAETSRMTGRAYQIDYEALPAESLREMMRLMRDLDQEKANDVRRARMMPWRRG
jgi:hypothetical protein